LASVEQQSDRPAAFALEGMRVEWQRVHTAAPELGASILEATPAQAEQPFSTLVGEESQWARSVEFTLVAEVQPGSPAPAETPTQLDTFRAQQWVRQAA